MLQVKIINSGSNRLTQIDSQFNLCLLALIIHEFKGLEDKGNDNLG